MDAVMADVTDVPGAPVDINDEFTLLGSSGNVRITAEDLARERTTNTWEVVTGMARRVPRVYHAAARPVGLRTLSKR
jgi:alanine racemase